MISKSQIDSHLHKTRDYLTRTLLPFWIDRSFDHKCGGFLTHFDRQGQPTGNTTKTFLMQIRMLFTMASAHRAGYGDGRCAELANEGATFILDHYWDSKHEGWNWIADRQGQITYDGKVGYGQCFALYAFSEYFLATGDERGREAADRTYAAICKNMTDSLHGGYFEIMQNDWTPQPGGRMGGDRKSFDVHMHMMEALTTYYEMTQSQTHRRRLIESIDILLGRMIHPVHGTGNMQFATDFTPLPAIRFDVAWGSDEEPDAQAFPIDWTSYGHNVEFAWLLDHAMNILGKNPRKTCDPRTLNVISRICDHCITFGLDQEYGGVYVDGPAAAPTQNTKKQFWQQAEVLVGFLVAYQHTSDDRYFHAFENVHQFIFNNLINFEGGGEWFALLDRQGNVLWDYLGHEWKISYHTVRSMIQSTRLLEAMSDA